MNSSNSSKVSGVEMEKLVKELEDLRDAAVRLSLAINDAQFYANTTNRILIERDLQRLMRDLISP